MMKLKVSKVRTKGPGDVNQPGLKQHTIGVNDEKSDPNQGEAILSDVFTIGNV
jgi:hypothetical protein